MSSLHAERPMTAREPALEARIVRYDMLVPCHNAFIDTRSPGSDRKENFTIIGPGVSENPDQHVHISEPHGFNIGGARQPPGCLNSQHSHLTAEVFYVHSGHWRFLSGETATDGHVDLGPGDLISLPTNMFRGFENIGDDTGFLWAVLGGDNPGKVLWAREVFAMAEHYGLILLENGELVDTTQGQTVSPGHSRMPITSAEQVAAMDVYDSRAMEAIVMRAENPGQPAQISERVLIGAGGLDWRHGFAISEIILPEGQMIGAHPMTVPDVWFVQSGQAVFGWDGLETVCGPGDTITVPIGAARSVVAKDDRCILLRVMGEAAL
jgi:quercetin dioxygenase-like cupin family protein